MEGFEPPDGVTRQLISSRWQGLSFVDFCAHLLASKNAGNPCAMRV